MTDSTSTSFSASTPLRFGMIGCGALGVVHARRLCDLPNVTVTAVHDPDPDAMQRVIDVIPPAPHETGARAQVAAYTDWAELVRHDGLNAVCISSPNRWHVVQLLGALAQNLHVLCEKPLSMNPDEVRQVVEATQTSGKIVSIAYQSRYRRDSRVLRAALQSGRWGRITSVDIFSSEDWITPNLGTWRHDPARCPGGFFADANGHQLDLLFWLTGMEATEIRATMETRGTRVPMVTWGEARLKAQMPSTLPLPPRPDTGLPAPEYLTAGVPFTFTFVGDAHQWREEISIQTERADFVLHDTRLLWTDGHAPLSPLSDAEADPAALHLPDTPDTGFVTALRGGPPIVTPPETVWPVLNFTLAALAAGGHSPTL
jgi:predicted dehydrogenase